MSKFRNTGRLLLTLITTLMVSATLGATPSDASNPSPAKTNDVTQTIQIEGKPAKHVAATLFDCKSGATIFGPTETDDNGVVKWEKVEDGKDCVRVTRALSSGSVPDVIDHSAQPVRVEVILSQVLPTWSEFAFPVVLCASIVLLVTVPILQFLLGPWKSRRDKLVGILSAQYPPKTTGSVPPSQANSSLADVALRLYYQKFRADVVIKDQSKAFDTSLNADDFEKAFRRDFGKWYGRRYYIFPLLILVLLTVFCAFWAALEAQSWISGTRNIDSMTGLSAAALTGGFMWVVSDEIDRLRRHDFTTSDLYYYIFRILLSIPFAWAVTRLQLTLQVGIPTAIFLGAFPTTTLFTIARRFGNQQLKLGDDPNSGVLELEKLQSIGKSNAERFREADISNIGQLTRADPVDLAIRTNFDFDYISDCVNEALLWVYVGEKIDKLAIYSVRGACEAWDLVDRKEKNDADATQTIRDIVAALGQGDDKVTLSESALLVTLKQAGCDPYTLFLKRIWRELPA